ncbi:MAG TPA: hypothetical protein VFR31_20390 [Thermoanaerobaculia bacterium]|nr:hypothetical protein [Thermoanaerobaculia bacterium]
MPKKSVAEHSLEWLHLVKSVGADPRAEFLRELVLELRQVRETILQLETERMAITARSQQITKDIGNLKNRGRIVASRIRSGLHTEYGSDSEKLTEHGMKPRRRRTGAAKAEQEAVERLTDDPVS